MFQLTFILKPDSLFFIIFFLFLIPYFSFLHSLFQNYRPALCFFVNKCLFLLCLLLLLYLSQMQLLVSPGLFFMFVRVKLYHYH